MQQATSQTIRRLHSEGLALGKLGKHKEAIAKFEKVIKIDERNNYAWHRKGIELNSLKKYRDALDCFEKAIVIRRDDRYAWNHRAVALRELGRYDEALQSCNEAIKINDRYAFGWYTKGSILQQLDDTEGAKKCFRRAVGLAPNNDLYRESLAGISELTGESTVSDRTDDTWCSKGFDHWRKGEHREAIICFDRALEMNGTDHVAWHRKGISLNALGRYEEALICFDRAIQINGDDKYAWNHRGEALREIGKYEDALASADEAIKSNERYPFAWYNRGTILQQLGDYAEATSCIEHALQLTSDAPWWDGGGAINRRLYAKRLAEITKPASGSRAAGRTSDPLHEAGLVLNKLGKHEEALAKFDEAARLNPDDNVAWHRKGIELNALGRYNEAVECFERAIHIDSRDKFAWNHRALSLCRMGNHRDAIVSCNEAIKIDDAYPFAWCNRAVIAAHLADFRDFEYSYGRARQLDPKGLLNQFLAENLPDPPERVPDRKGDIELFVYYCCDLCLVHLKAHEIPQTLKYALDLKKYASEKVRAMLMPLIDELEFRVSRGIAVTEELIERADAMLHQVKMGW